MGGGLENAAQERLGTWPSFVPKKGLRCLGRAPSPSPSPRPRSWGEAERDCPRTEKIQLKDPICMWIWGVNAPAMKGHGGSQLC